MRMKAFCYKRNISQAAQEIKGIFRSTVYYFR
jgi:hypothetical protein